MRESSARQAWIVHAGAFVGVNALMFALRRRRGDPPLRRALIQLASWGGGLAYHYYKGVHHPSRRPQHGSSPSTP